MLKYIYIYIYTLYSYILYQLLPLFEEDILSKKQTFKDSHFKISLF